MNMTGILTALIICCLVFLALAAFAKPLKVVARFLVCAAVGGCCLWISNRLGLNLGVNPATLLTVGTLGLPGFLGLVALSFFL